TRAQDLKTSDPRRELGVCRTRIAELERRMVAQPPHLLRSAQQRFERVEGILRVVGPEATLRRGYSITTDAAGKVMRTVAAARPETKIRTRVSDGEFQSEVFPTVARPKP